MHQIKDKPKAKKGFSLIELLLSVWILFIIFSLVNQNYFQQQRDIEFEIARDELKNTLIEARENSRTYKDGSVYGVKLTPHQYYLFKGSSYSNTGELVTSELPSFIELENLNFNNTTDEIIFEKNTGNTENYWDFKIKSNDNDSATFTINKLGFISIE